MVLNKSTLGRRAALCASPWSMASKQSTKQSRHWRHRRHVRPLCRGSRVQGAMLEVHQVAIADFDGPIARQTDQTAGYSITRTSPISARRNFANRPSRGPSNLMVAGRAARTPASASPYPAAAKDRRVSVLRHRRRGSLTHGQELFHPIRSITPTTQPHSTIGTATMILKQGGKNLVTS